MERSSTVTAAFVMLCTLHVGATELTTGTVAESGVRNWTLRDSPLEIKLQQLTLDQTRAFYLGRGFTAAEADRIALGCVFQTVVRNIGTKGTVTLNLARWRLQYAGAIRPIKLKQEWDREFEVAGSSNAARIAFRWATFPTEQEFEPTDYNWGMTTFGLPPGSLFDLTLHWLVDGEPNQALIQSVQCAGESMSP